VAKILRDLPSSQYGCFLVSPWSAYRASILLTKEVGCGALSDFLTLGLPSISGRSAGLFSTLGPPSVAEVPL